MIFASVCCRRNVQKLSKNIKKTKQNKTGPVMQYTLNQALSLSAGGNCVQFPNKNKYSELQLGGASKFSLFYLDLSVAIESLPNSKQQAGVRPPC